MQNFIKNKLLPLVPAFIWMTIIFYFSSGQTTAVTGTSIERFIILKSMHIAEYAILFTLLNWGGFSYKKALIISYIYALSDEFHQSFVPGRSALLRDTFIDLFGICLSYIIISLTAKKNKTIMNKIIY